MIEMRSISWKGEAILRKVAKIIIDPVNRLVGRTRAHVREKVFEPLPSGANRNAAFDVTVRSIAIFVSTPD
jgi:hypothetical protein